MGTQRHRQAPPLTFSNAHAERGLLGYYLARTGVDPTLQAEVRDLDVDLFQVPLHRKVIQALQEVVAAGDPVDLVTVSDELRRIGTGTAMSLDLVDLEEQAAVTPSPHRRILESCMRRRRIDAQVQHLHTKVLDPSANLDSVMLDLRATIDAADAHPTDPRFRLVPGEEMRHRPQRPWLVARLIPAGAFSVMTGHPGSGKTFVALDLALHVAGGLPWQGRTVTQGAAVYVAAEAQGSIPPRLDAWARFHGTIVPPNFYVVPETVLVGTHDVHDLVAALRSLPESPALLVIDTLSWCLGGADENASEAMSAVLSATRLVHEAVGSAVLWIHHPSAAGKALRGHTSLHGATDVEIVVTRGRAAGQVVLSCGKMKDDAEFTPFAVALRPLASDEGAPLSCVVVPVDALKADASNLRPSAQRALAILADRFAEGTTFSKWHAQTGGSKSTFNIAIADLTAASCIRHSGEGRGARYHITDLGRSLVKGSIGSKSARSDQSDQGQRKVRLVHTPIGVDHRADAADRLADSEAPPELTTSVDVAGEAEPCVVCGLPSTTFSSSGESWCLGCWETRCAPA